MEEKLDHNISLLENRLQNLIADYIDLKKAFSEMQDLLDKQHLLNQKLNDKVIKLEQENVLIKNTNALLGSDEFKKETKLKINALVKEIDQCIAQLS